MGTNPNRPLSAGPHRVFDFADSISYLKGKRAYRFGGRNSPPSTGDSLVYVSGRGQIGFSGGNLDSTSTGLEDFFAGLPLRAQLLTGNPNVKTTWMNYAGYAQDDWRLNPRLTFNLGLRYSYISPNQGGQQRLRGLSQFDTFLAEFDFQNSNSFSLGAVPTGAVIENERFGIGLQQPHRRRHHFAGHQ